MEGRAGRAIALIVVALVGVVVAGVIHLQPSLPPPASLAPAPRVVDWQVLSVSFGDADHGVVALTQGTAAAVYLTADGGRSWRRSPDLSASFSNGRIATAVGIGPTSLTLRRSLDGGLTWRSTASFPVTGLASLAGSPYFLDADHGWLVSGMVTGGDPATVTGLMLWQTLDGGRTWARLTAAGLPGGVVSTLVFTDPLRGAAVVLQNGGRGRLMVTSDGGESWRPTAPPEPPAAAGSPPRTGVLAQGRRLVSWWALADLPRVGTLTVQLLPQVVDLSFYVTVSEDGGATWGPLQAGPTMTAPYLAGSIGPRLDDRGRLLFLDDRRLWVSEDGGASWTARLVQAPAGVRPLAIVAARGALYAVGSRLPATPSTTRRLESGLPETRDVLLRSRDGGIHWEEIALPRT